MEKKKINYVFLVSLLVTIGLTLWGIVFPEQFKIAADVSFGFLVNRFGWLYLLVMSLFVVFSLWIGLSKYGKIKLGADDSKPEYSLISWFAMLFSAGMGIGLVFWGIAEPLNHYINPLNMEGGTTAAKDFALTKSFVHWGLHPWANYAVLALALAYMQFRKGKPGLISSVFIPLIGEKLVKGFIGKIIDILAIFATVAGVATSLGLGAMQINSGLNMEFGIPQNNFVLILIVLIITVLFMATAIIGLDKGIKFLANLNIGIAGVLILITLIVGPALLICINLFKGMGLYLVDIVTDANPFGKGNWYSSWTIFYWAWWIAWAPFVGTFIARISKGRTIREFIFGVLLAPTLASFIWFAIFGTTAMETNINIASDAIAKTETALFVVMGSYGGLGKLVSIITIPLLCTFFVTSANSATFVLGMLSSNGKLNPPNNTKAIWGITQSALALALMLSGGLGMLQTASIVAAFPFIFVMFFAMISMVKALKNEDLSAIK